MLAQIEITPASDEWWGPYLGFNYSPWAGLYVHSIPFHDVFHVGHSNANPKGGGGGTACDESYQRIPDGGRMDLMPGSGRWAFARTHQAHPKRVGVSTSDHGILSNEVVIEVQSEWDVGLEGSPREVSCGKWPLMVMTQTGPKKVLPGQEVSFLQSQGVPGTQTHWSHP